MGAPPRDSILVEWLCGCNACDCDATPMIGSELRGILDEIMYRTVRYVADLSSRAPVLNPRSSC